MLFYNIFLMNNNFFFRFYYFILDIPILYLIRTTNFDFYTKNKIVVNFEPYFLIIVVRGRPLDLFHDPVLER
jgi:hypothetical protein